jgi:hypothetical protein
MLRPGIHVGPLDELEVRRRRIERHPYPERQHETISAVHSATQRTLRATTAFLAANQQDEGRTREGQERDQRQDRQIAQHVD